jgi:hypothetical protein
MVFTSLIPVQSAASAPAAKSETAVEKTSGVSKPDKKTVSEGLGSLGLSFEENIGQTDPGVRYLARSPYYTLFLTDREAVFRFRKENGGKVARDVLRMQFNNAERSPAVEGIGKLEATSSYFIGDQESNWRRGLKNFGRVNYHGIYEGIDAVFYGAQKALEYDFIVAPNIDPSVISLSFAGARNVSIDKDGSLVLKIKNETIRFGAPVSYQDTEAGRQPVASRYVLEGAGKIGFKIGEYDKSKALVIDPKLIFSTYVGGNVEFIDIVEGTGDSVNGLDADAAGNVYITGNTDSTDFPVSANGYQQELDLRGDDACLIGGPLPCGDAYVTKINPAGNAIIYSTYLGGHNSDAGFAIAVDGSGRAYVAGGTDPFNAGQFCINPYLFPTKNPYQNKPCYGQRRDSDGFFTVLTAGGDDIVYSTYFGGGDEDQANSIAIDNSGNAYIAGETTSRNLPEKNGFQTDLANDHDTINDAFIAKFNPAESGNDSLLYASYLGGSGDDIARGIAVDDAGNAYVVGSTQSNNLTTKAPGGAPLRAAFNGGLLDGFISKIDPTHATGPNSLVYLSYFGGSGIDVVNAIAVEPATQRAHITGRSDNTIGFPLLNQFDGTATATDAFVAKLNADGTALFYSSFLGGNSFDEGRGITIDAANNVYLTGKTLSSGFPNINAFQTVNNAGGDAFVTKLSAVTIAGRPKILYSSFLGGGSGPGGGGRDDGNAIALDGKGNVYFGGVTTSPTFPTTLGALKRLAPGIEAGNTDGFVAKVDSTFNDGVGTFRGTNQFILSNSTNAPNEDISLGLLLAGDVPLTGDWDRDGDDDLGVYNSSTGQFLIRTKVKICTLCPATVQAVTINFGQAGDLPVTGDWNADGFDTIGVFRPGAGQFLLNNDQLSTVNFTTLTLQPQITVNFGIAGDQPVAGDWDSDGEDSVGVFRPTAGQFFLTNDNELQANVDIGGNFGAAEDLAIAGDFDGDGKDTIGMWRPSIATFFLTNDNVNLAATFVFGLTGDKPVAGEWDGKPNQ